MSYFLNWLFSQYQEYTFSLMVLELIASTFGLISVILSKRANILVFPIGLISTGLYTYLLWRWQLFGDMLINSYYSVMSIAGWINWSHNKQSINSIIKIETTNQKEWWSLIWIALVTFLLVAIIYYFKPVINNNFLFDGTVLGIHTFVWTDFVDILTTGLFLVAMLLMAKRKIEHWIIWIIADFISIPLYFYKGLMFTSLQYLLFTIIAIFGYISWSKLLKK